MIEIDEIHNRLINLGFKKYKDSIEYKYTFTYFYKHKNINFNIISVSLSGAIFVHISKDNKFDIILYDDINIFLEKNPIFLRYYKIKNIIKNIK